MAVKHGTAQQAYDDGYRDGLRATRLEKLEKDRRLILQIATDARENGLNRGAVIWRESLEKIIELSRQ